MCNLFERFNLPSPLPFSHLAVQKIVAALQNLQPVGIPTETVYGLAADATQDAAVARIFDLKGRPRFNPLIIHVANLEAARTLAHFSDAALTLAQTFWPGPLTLVLPATAHNGLSPLVNAGLSSIALRVPRHDAALAVLHAFGKPLAAPSANLSGRLSPTTAQHVINDFGDALPLVLDGGTAAVGLESTVIAALPEGVFLLRKGGLARQEIEAVLSAPVLDATHPHSDQPLSPGQLLQHYAPRARLRLEALTLEPGEALLAFGSIPPALQHATLMRNLSPKGDLVEAARHFFDYLHALDLEGAQRIAVMPIPPVGLGEAINDRLVRGANLSENQR